MGRSYIFIYVVVFLAGGSYTGTHLMRILLPILRLLSQRQELDLPSIPSAALLNFGEAAGNTGSWFFPYTLRESLECCRGVHLGLSLDCTGSPCVGFRMLRTGPASLWRGEQALGILIGQPYK